MSTEGAVVPSGEGRPPRVSAAHLARARTPYVVLAGIQLGAVLVCLVFAIPGTQEPARTGTMLGIAAVLGVAVAFTWFVGPRLPHDLGIDVGIWLGAVMGAGTLLTTPTDEGQVLIAMGLSCYGVTAAYFLPKHRLRLALGGMIGLYLLGWALNPQMSGIGVVLLTCVVIVGLALLVSRLVEQLRELALRDELTTLLNRRGLDLLTPPLLAACARSGIPVTVGLIDLDQFKVYNDTHGHLAGDRLLQHVARAWIGAVRESDLACRFGGDEFAVVLVDTTVDAAAALERRVRETCPETSSGASAGWSVGWAQVRKGESLYEALERADVALFAAKKEHGARRL